MRTLLVDGLLVRHHVFRAGVGSGSGHVTWLRVVLNVLLLSVVGCVVVEL